MEKKPFVEPEVNDVTPAPADPHDQRPDDRADDPAGDEPWPRHEVEREGSHEPPEGRPPA